MDFKNLTEEQKKKIAECKTPEDYLTCAKEIGYKLSDDDLDKINGGTTGSWGYNKGCPVCGSADVNPLNENGPFWHCNSCGIDFPVL